MALRGPNPRAGSKGCGLLCPTIDPDLTMFVPGQNRTGPIVGQTGRISGTKKGSPRSANSRPLRWVVVRNPRANAGFHSIPFGQEPRSGASWHLAVSCAPNRKSGPLIPMLIPSLSFPHDCNDLLPAQVPRSARRRSTSRLHGRARHVWRRGTVHSSL